MFVKASSVTVCSASFLYTFYVLRNLTYFLSHHGDTETRQLKHNSLAEGQNIILWSLLIDMSLLSFFILQHTVMAKNLVKRFFSKLHMQHLDRSIYNVASAAVLHLLMANWKSIPSVAIWNINTTSNALLWLLFVGIHVVTWTIIYSGCLIMDISELAGLKQVYYKISGRPDPVTMKSKELLRFYSHQRHPSFTGFLIILWIHPFMTIDRLLLASVLTIYMVMLWTIDQADYTYHASLVKLKEAELF